MSALATRCSLGALLMMAGVTWVLSHGVALLAQTALPADLAKRVRPGEVLMVSSTSCSYCAQARTWFEHQKVPFTECVIERDSRCARLYSALGEPGTPLVSIRGQRVLGYDVRAWVDALSAAVPVTAELPST